GAPLLEAAREALVGAIHLGIAVAAAIAVVSIWQTRHVPPVKLQRKVEPVIHAD
ncbi:MAG TPA: MFS transporter, partial [Paraburkholderia sp.]|nr:MFS transporter [Paraburkholderia sp.]